MNKETIIAGVVGLVIGILLVPLFLPTTTTMWGHRMIYRDSMTDTNQMAKQIDSHFIEQMIPHHEDAIVMANLALTSAEHKEIKTLANDIIKTQSEEIDQMKQWY